VILIANSDQPADRVRAPQAAVQIGQAALIAASRALHPRRRAVVLAAANQHKPGDLLAPTNPNEALTVND
jgi:hypothetical protein